LRQRVAEGEVDVTMVFQPPAPFTAAYLLAVVPMGGLVLSTVWGQRRLTIEAAPQIVAIFIGLDYPF
jgi:hypothetical protein